MKKNLQQQQRAKAKPQSSIANFKQRVQRRCIRCLTEKDLADSFQHHATKKRWSFICDNCQEKPNAN